jgi:hypothetical protein
VTSLPQHVHILGQQCKPEKLIINVKVQQQQFLVTCYMALTYFT